jgi:uncharacterized membrane protein YhaH (DUF805 family)
VRLPRLRRRDFWLLTLAVWLVFFAVRAALLLDRPGLPGTLWAALCLSAIAALAVARLHDRNRSGWWLAAAMVPVAGALWLAWELACRRGRAHANAWGADPLERPSSSS